MTSRFKHYRPQSTAEASDLLGQLGDDSAVYCGGTELLQVMKMGLASFGHLIDLKGIEELRGLDVEADGSLRIGATTTHRDVEKSIEVRHHFPTLSRLERDVANVRVRNTGSIVGNLCFAEPHSDPAVLLMAANATLMIEGNGRKRSVPLTEFILGPLATTLDHGEIVSSIRVPAHLSGTYFGYSRIAFYERPAASVAARLTLGGGTIESGAVVVGAVGDRPSAIEGVEGLLTGAAAANAKEAFSAVARLAASECEAYGDINGSEDYKRHLVEVLAQRALNESLQQGME